ncbi:MAG: biopolymer transporter ExbD [Gemmobacter sp.]
MPRLASARRRRPLSLTSLIDVIFLLLLFFMLTSVFDRHGDLPFMAAGGGMPSDTGSAPAFLRVTPDALVLNTTAVDLAGLAAALENVGAPLVLVAPAGNVTAQRLVDVLVAARDAQGISLRLIRG